MACHSGLTRSIRNSLVDVHRLAPQGKHLRDGARGSYRWRVLRDFDQVRAATELVAADLRRVLGGSWSCRLDDHWVLTVSDGARAEASLLGSEVEDEAWYVNERWPEEEQRAALDAEAGEAVATEVIELLRVLGAGPLTCPQHGAELGSCEGVWYCEGATGHDVALIGRLGTDRVFDDVEDTWSE